MILSIIIPTYNREKLIRYTLDSLNKSHHLNIDFEIIVIDDNSTDGTVDMVKSNFPGVILLKNSGKGAASARNVGLKASQSKYVLYLDSDDLVGDNYFLKKIQFLEQHSEIDACYGAYDSFESNDIFSIDKIVFKYKYPLIENANSALVHLCNYLDGFFTPLNTIIWKRDFLMKIGGHNEELSVNQDVELFIKAIFNGMNIIAVQDNTKVYVRSHAIDTRVGVVGNSEKKYSDILELRRKIFLEMKERKITDKKCLHSLSYYLFCRWRDIRLTNPELANRFLELSKQVYWPINIRGGIVLKVLSKILGPVKAVKVKTLFQ